MKENDYCVPTRFVDSAHPAIVRFATNVAAPDEDDSTKAKRLFQAVRDSVDYDLYIDLSSPANYTASAVLASGRGFCVGKAALLAACARSIGIPARVGYADVRNHMTSARIHELTDTDVFIWHSYAELRLGTRWVKATPAFNASLCERVGISPLEFDGRNDALLQPFDKSGQRYMEYLIDRGTFLDVPFSRIIEDFRIKYPRLMAAGKPNGEFEAEATAQHQAGL